MSDSGSGSKDSVTEVAEESFVRERAPDIERGTVLAGRYQIEDIIGKGGSGIVLRVFDRTAQNVVALKVLKSELARDAKWERRFSRELRLGRPIQHPNVCRIFDIGEADGHRFLTMEIARGGSLRDALKRSGAPERPIAERLSDARAAIEGLAAIHAAGVVHRDVKPDNLLRMEDGRLVISDFGLATDAANAPGVTVLIGTPHYMAPEVLAGEPATSRSDVWALGVVLHEIFFGRRPERRSVSFDGSGKGPLRPRSSTERAVLSLCERCLSDAPLERPADAGAVAQQLKALLASPGDRRLNWPRAFVIGVCATIFALVGPRVLRSFRRAPRAELAPASLGPPRLQPKGQAVDWSKTTRVVADIPGRVHCFSMLNDRTARLIWGGPRRAEDVELESGRRHPSDLDPVAYRVGCPELSVSGALVFTAQNAAGVSEIRLSNTSDGRSARPITSGSEPLWLDDGDEFVYDVDPSHAAVFSLPTMSFALLGMSEPGKRRMIVDKAIGKRKGAIALLLYDENSNYMVAIYQGSEFDKERVFVVPTAHRIQFGERNESLLISYQVSRSISALGVLDWREGTLRDLGRYPEFDIIWARLTARGSAPGDVLLTRRLSSDLYSYDEGVRRKLTTDGKNYSGDRSRSGDLLLSKWNDDGSINVWRQEARGEIEQLTHGRLDVEPRFSPDGNRWVYVDLVEKGIELCSLGVGRCESLVHDEGLPAFATFSPDGRNVAYLTQVGVQRLKIVSADTGREGVSWDATSECPPVWSTSSRIWSLETSAGHYVWSERETGNGAKTGERVEIESRQDPGGKLLCWPSPSRHPAPPFQNIRVETAEISRLLVFK